MSSTGTDFTYAPDESLEEVIALCPGHGRFSYCNGNLVFGPGYRHELWYPVSSSLVDFLLAHGIIQEDKYDDIMPEQYFTLTERGRELKRLKTWKKFLIFEQWKAEGGWWDVFRRKYWWLLLIIGWAVGLTTYWLQQKYLK